MFFAAYFLIMLVFLAYGMFLFVWPDKYHKLLDRSVGVEMWSKQTPRWNPKGAGPRSVGLALILFSLFMILGPPLLAYLHAPAEIRNHIHRGTSSGPSWGGVILLVFLLVLGVSFLIKPLAVVNRFAPRNLALEPDAARGAFAIRIFGGFLVLISLLGVWVQVLRGLHS